MCTAQKMKFSIKGTIMQIAYVFQKYPENFAFQL